VTSNITEDTPPSCSSTNFGYSPLPAVHLVFGLVKRWLLGTHHGAVSAKYLQAYLGEYVFRFNRRHAKSPAHGFARVLQNAVRIPPATHRDIVTANAT